MGGVGRQRLLSGFEHLREGIAGNTGRFFCSLRPDLNMSDGFPDPGQRCRRSTVGRHNCRCSRRTFLRGVGAVFVGLNRPVWQVKFQQVASLPIAFQLLSQLSQVLIGIHIKHPHAIARGVRVGQFSQLDQQILNFFHLNGVRIDQQTIVLSISFHLEGWFFRCLLVLHAKVKETVSLGVWIGVFLLHFFAHQQSDCSSHIFCVQTPQCDYFNFSRRLIQLVHKCSDCQMIGDCGPGDDRTLLFVDLQHSARIKISQLLKKIGQCLRIDRFQTIHFHAIDVLQQRHSVVAGHIDLLNGLFDHRHLIGSRLCEDHIFPLIQYQTRLNFGLRPRRSGCSCLSRRLLHLHLHLLHLLSLLHHLHRHVGIHRRGLRATSACS